MKELIKDPIKATLIVNELLESNTKRFMSNYLNISVSTLNRRLEDNKWNLEQLEIINNITRL